MISESPKISVIVPCYRTERWLDRCVASLVNQTLQDIEIILVDDGSPDRVPAICDEWAAKDALVRMSLYSERNFRIHSEAERIGRTSAAIKKKCRPFGLLFIFLKVATKFQHSKFS